MNTKDEKEVKLDQINFKPKKTKEETKKGSSKKKTNALKEVKEQAKDENLE